MNPTVLMLAFYFPPFAQSTGGQRVLSFIRHLPKHGWTPIVLTAREQVFADIDARSTALIPPGTEVVRACGLDVARHLSVRGRYPNWLAVPDRWMAWGVCASVLGLSVVRRRSPEVLWATFPIPSALLAALALHRMTGLPLVVDLRDPLVYDQWPADPLSRRANAWIERRIVRAARAVVVTTPGARNLYLERYPEVPAERFVVIANGVDEEAVPFSSAASASSNSQCVTLVHSGLMEVPDRDPTALFAALAAMRDRGEISPARLQVVLRATGRDEAFARQIGEFGLGDFVQLRPRLSHADAVKELAEATGLLLFQGQACNRQIPAKAYEYLACRRPIIGLCDPGGDTHDLLARQWGVPYMADMARSDDIEHVLRRFVGDCSGNTTYVPPQGLVARHARSVGARQLAALLDEAAR